MKLYIEQVVTAITALTGMFQVENKQLTTKTTSTPAEDSTESIALSVFSKTGELSEGFRVCYQENELLWKDRYYLGGTGYIDGIRPTDLDNPIHCGQDPYGRKFIAFKYTCTKKDGEVEIGALTIFQRHMGGMQLAAGGWFRPEGCSDLGDLDPRFASFAEAFPKFLSGEEIEVPEFGFGQNKDIEMTLKLCDDISCPSVVALPAPADYDSNQLKLPSLEETGSKHEK